LVDLEKGRLLAPLAGGLGVGISVGVGLAHGGRGLLSLAGFGVKQHV
jgi:hypothetical protein